MFPSITGFHWVLLGFTGFYWFYWVLLVFSGLHWVFTGFYWVLLGFNEFYWVLLGFTGFFLVLLGFAGFYWVLLGFIVFFWVKLGFYWVLLGLNILCWVFTGFSGFGVEFDRIRPMKLVVFFIYFFAGFFSPQNLPFHRTRTPRGCFPPGLPRSRLRRSVCVFLLFFFCLFFIFWFDLRRSSRRASTQSDEWGRPYLLMNFFFFQNIEFHLMELTIFLLRCVRSFDISSKYRRKAMETTTNEAPENPQSRTQGPQNGPKKTRRQKKN